MTQSDFIRWVAKPTVFVLALVPFGLLLFDGFTGGLGGNPVEEITYRTGDWTLYFLLITLAVSPLKRLTGLNQLVRFRRMVGLFAFFYAFLHFMTYIGLDLFFYLPEVVEDVAKRPYITVGFTALLILTALAITSPKAMIKKLGGKRWNALHSLIYLAAGLGIVHFMWLVKADVRRPTILGLILIVLLAFRLWPPARRRRKPKTKRVSPRMASAGGVSS